MTELDQWNISAQTGAVESAVQAAVVTAEIPGQSGQQKEDAAVALAMQAITAAGNLIPFVHTILALPFVPSLTEWAVRILVKLAWARLAAIPGSGVTSSVITPVTTPVTTPTTTPGAGPTIAPGARGPDNN